MKYTYLINARAIVDFNNSLNSKEKITIKDAMVAEYLRDFIASGKMKKIETERGTFYWISYKKIIEDNPLLELKSKGSISKIIKKLVNFGLLDKWIDKEDGNKLYFKFTELYHKSFVEFTPIQNNERGYSTQETPYSTQETNYINKDYINKNNINKRKYQNAIISETDINGNKYDALNNKDNNKKELNKKINNKKENINNSKIAKNISKGEEESKQTKETSKAKENLQNLIFFIKSFLKEKNIILSPKQNFSLENVIISLSKSYPLEEIKEVLEFAKEHSFYYKFLANPKALENNFNSIRLEYLQQKEKEEENTFFFGLGG